MTTKRKPIVVRFQAATREQLAERLQVALMLRGVRISRGLYRVTVEQLDDTKGSSP